MRWWWERGYSRRTDQRIHSKRDSRPFLTSGGGAPISPDARRHARATRWLHQHIYDAPNQVGAAGEHDLALLWNEKATASGTRLASSGWYVARVFVCEDDARHQTGAWTCEDPGQWAWRVRIPHLVASFKEKRILFPKHPRANLWMFPRTSSAHASDWIIMCWFKETTFHCECLIIKELPHITNCEGLFGRLFPNTRRIMSQYGSVEYWNERYMKYRFGNTSFIHVEIRMHLSGTTNTPLSKSRSQSTWRRRIKYWILVVVIQVSISEMKW